MDSSDSAGIEPVRSRSRFHSRKFWSLGVGAVLVSVLVVLFAVTWFYSSEIQSGAFELDRSEDEFDLRISSITDTAITLVTEDSAQLPESPGRFGLESESGAYGFVTEILTTEDSSVSRRFEQFEGAFAVNDRVRLERAALPGDPLRSLGISFEEVEIESPLGPMPAWFVNGDRDTWAVMVHGRTSTRLETLRSLDIMSRAGFPVLSISYRNDERVAEDPSGEYRFGITEWEDLDAAVQFALQNGADRVILFGLSMGGSIVAHFMIESDLSDRAVGLVLDAPLLNLTEAMNLAADQRGLPQFLPWMAARLSTIRFGTDWAALDTRKELLETDVPILLFHGSDDATIPASQSRRFAEKAGPRVTYIEVEYGEHVGSWNVDPDAYEHVLLDWLSDNAFMR